MVYQPYQEQAPTYNQNAATNGPARQTGRDTWHQAEEPFAEDNPPEAEYPGEPLQELHSPPLTYAEFLKRNPKTGSLKIQAYTAQQAMPVSGAQVIISKDFADGTREVFSGITDRNGIVDNIVLPAPDRLLAERPMGALPYSDYNVRVYHPDYRMELYTNVPVFDGIKSIQSMQFLPYR